VRPGVGKDSLDQLHRFLRIRELSTAGALMS